MTVAADKQKLSPGRRVELFDLDVSLLQVGLIYRFCSSYNNNVAVAWRGNDYSPLPLQAEGFETSGRGTLPTPTLKISNIALLVSTILHDLGDITGSKVTRWVTFADYLDGGTLADPNQHFIPEIYYIERKVNENKLFVEFELSASLDQEGRQLPGRQVIRDGCVLKYRKYDSVTNTFDYTNATCPWAGKDNTQGGAATSANEGPLFTSAGLLTTTPADDQCGKKLSDCILRFKPWNLDLPFGGFPGVARTHAQ